MCSFLILILIQKYNKNHKKNCKKTLTLFFIRYKILYCTIMGAYVPISQQKDLQNVNIITLDIALSRGNFLQFCNFLWCEMLGIIRDNTL